MAYLVTFDLIFTIFFLFFGVRTVFANSVVLNELMPHPSPGSDWIEIYNPTDNNIDLSNWILVDSTSTMKTLSGSISAKGFVTFDVTNRLNNSGDSIYLKDSSSTTIDNYSYSLDPGINKSIGRNPDGGSWTTLASSSKGTSNGQTPPTANPTPAPTSTTNPTDPPSNPSTSLFTVSSTPSQINSDQSFKVLVNLSLSNNPNTTFYIKGAFKKSDSSNYFGFTKADNTWVKNNSSYSDQYHISTDSSGNWSGNLEIQSDSEDSGFIGSGDYVFKVGRYTQSGSGPSWSNENTINILAIASQDNQESPTQTMVISSSKTNTPSPSTLQKPSSVKASSTPKLNYQIASVAGVNSSSSATPSGETLSKKVAVKSERVINFLPWLGGILIISGISSLIYVYLRNKK